MARNKSSAVAALKKIDTEREAFEARAAEARRAAALELGELVLAAGGARLDPDRIARLIADAAGQGTEAKRAGNANGGGGNSAALCRDAKGVPERANG